MLISITVAVDSIRAWMPCSLLSASMIPFATGALGIGATSWITSKHVFQKLDNTLYRAYMRLCLFVFENLSSAQLKLYGDVEVLKSKKENVLVLSNHQTNVDWAVIVMLAARQNNEQGFRVMVKHAIHYTPLFGWYIFQHGYIYVRRFGDFVQTPVLRQLRWLNSLDDPYWLLIFPEGTRYIKKKAKLIESSQEFCRKNNLRPLENVLSPRVGGIQLAVEHLNSLDAIYDVTIAYGQERLPNRRGLAPGMFEFVCGPFEGREVHVHVKRYDIKEIPRDKDGLRNWIRQVYDEKDKLLDNFYTTGSYTEKVEEEGKSSEYSVENSVSIYRTLPPTLAFSAALIAPIFSQTARKAYLITIASFPLLICWLHVRKCV